MSKERKKKQLREHLIDDVPDVIVSMYVEEQIKIDPLWIKPAYRKQFG